MVIDWITLQSTALHACYLVTRSPLIMIKFVKILTDLLIRFKLKPFRSTECVDPRFSLVWLWWYETMRFAWRRRQCGIELSFHCGMDRMMHDTRSVFVFTAEQVFRQSSENLLWSFVIELLKYFMNDLTNCFCLVWVCFHLKCNTQINPFSRCRYWITW